MTGPDIHRARHGFAIGVSAIGGPDPIGTVQAFDVWETVISQFANSPVLMQLILNMDSYLDQSANFDDFYDKVMNVLTAQGWGLDVWGRIVDVSRTLSVTEDEALFLGFQEAGQTAQPFNNAPFYSGQQINDVFVLTDSAYRVLILAKALANICDGSIPAINQILLNLFPGRGNCYVVDNLDMTMVYKFDFIMTAVELAIVGQSGVLPRSTGVSATVESLLVDS
ncbi:DUF2612 domain-containing protein [Bradyrhizobium sp. LjRoot220]|uniref:DUF2612 domain-containing protein n=1 Tax=Bradyrhizobium sp. LjRoot220 TaxID=3342284 RepID=UPI003ECE29AC